MSLEKRSASHADGSSVGKSLDCRDFVQASVAGAAALSLSSAAVQPGEGLQSSGSMFAEPVRKLTVADECDVIVCGGGPAGFSAAISAARTGAKTRLFDVNGCLGGGWTAGMLTYLLTLMVNHEYGIRPFDAAQVSDATMRARAEIYKVVRRLRSLGGVWEGIQLVATAEQIGIRDGRRINGRYQVTKDDLIQGARHKDGVARVTFGVDVHAATRKENDKKAISHEGIRMKPYDIPLRALIAKDVDGLMMAGRCISGDFLAHASYRVTGNAVAMGEAAGTVSAIAAKSRRLPHEVSWDKAKLALKRG